MLSSRCVGNEQEKSGKRTYEYGIFAAVSGKHYTRTVRNSTVEKERKPKYPIAQPNVRTEFLQHMRKNFVSF